MLPSNLLIARRRGDTIMPVYAESNVSNMELAKYLIEVYSSHVGQRKKVLDQVVSELEDWGYDYRFVRGLAVLLDRRCQMQAKAVVNPIEARRRVFQTATEKGIPTSQEERSVILSQVANEFKVNFRELEESIYCDLDDEMVIADFNPIDPVNLLKGYNVSITQTMLFNGSELSLTTSSNWQRIFRQIKWLGLIYTARLDNGSFWVKVDGPVSLFKLSRRYGTSLAKLLPSIIQNRVWKLRAKVLSRTGNTLLNLELDSTRHRSYLPESIDEKDEGFDSRVEEDFAARFRALGTGWTLTREPDPLPVGEYVMIPDFALEKGGSRIYLEIVGFWTPEYIEDKMKKLDMAKGIDMIVAIDRNLACRMPSKRYEHLNLLYYKDKVPLKPILEHLRMREKHLVEKEVRNLQSMELNLTSSVFDTYGIANLMGISVEAVKEMIEKLHAPGHRRIGEIFISENLLGIIKDALANRLESGRLNFEEASKLIESLGGRNPSTVLDALGYRVVWHGIEPKSAEVCEKA